MRAFKSLRIWGPLFLLGLAFFGFSLFMGILYYFGYGPDWVGWLGVSGLGLMVVAIFGWLVTFDRHRTRPPPD
jgi:hypothetical protein